MKNQFVRLRTGTGEYVHSLHGVVYVSYVTKKDVDHAALFPIQETDAEQWRIVVSQIAEQPLLIEPVTERATTREERADGSNQR